MAGVSFFKISFCSLLEEIIIDMMRSKSVGSPMVVKGCRGHIGWWCPRWLKLLKQPRMRLSESEGACLAEGICAISTITIMSNHSVAMRP